MTDTIVCPHCKGTGVNYVIAQQDGRPTIEPVSCVVCEGKGAVSAPVLETPLRRAATEPGELWPILVPLGIFFLFFTFLLV